jgi:hypothetical protein
MLEFLLPLLLVWICLHVARHSQRAWLAAIAYAVGTFLIWWGLAGEPAGRVLLVSLILLLVHWGLFAVAVRWEGTILWWLAVGAMYLLLTWPLALSLALGG